VIAQVSAAIRSAMMDAPSIADELAIWQDEPAIFTRRPVPAEVGYPMSIINPPAAVGDEDGLTSDRPVWVGDVAFYGEQPKHLRQVDRAASAARLLFHRQKFSVQPDGFSVIDITVAGPIPAPVDDDMTVGRLVTLTIRLRRTS